MREFLYIDLGVLGRRIRCLICFGEVRRNSPQQVVERECSISACKQWQRPILAPTIDGVFAVLAKQGVLELGTAVLNLLQTLLD